MKKARAFLPYALGILPFAIPYVVFAAGAAGLVPCGASYIPFEATSCQACDFVQLIQNILKFIIELAIPIAAGLFAYAGIKLMISGGSSLTTANPNARNDALKIVRTTMIGFVLVLSGWFIVNTVIYVVAGKQFNGSTWFTISCSDQNKRDRTESLASVFSKLVVSNPTNGTQSQQSSTISTGGNGSLVQVQTKGPDGTSQNLGLNATKPDSELQGIYNSVQQKYGSQIESACQGSSVPNCTEVLTSLASVESSGNANAFNSAGGGSCGLTQVSCSACTSGDTQCQLNVAEKNLATDYTRFGNLPNAIAAYNTGATTQAGQGTKGGSTAMVTSNSDPTKGCGSSYFAWQCTTQPAGLLTTQKEVANICQTLKLAGKSC